jgi:hypothetical protein
MIMQAPLRQFLETTKVAIFTKEKKNTLRDFGLGMVLGAAMFQSLQILFGGACVP